MVRLDQVGVKDFQAKVDELAEILLNNTFSKRLKIEIFLVAPEVTSHAGKKSSLVGEVSSVNWLVVWSLIILILALVR